VTYSNIYPTRCDVTQFILSGNCCTRFVWYLHPSSGAQNNSNYSIWYSSHRYCYLWLSWKSWNWFECAVGGVRHPQHTQTSTLVFAGVQLVWNTLSKHISLLQQLLTLTCITFQLLTSHV